MSPKVSIVLPTYNQREYLSDALESIFAQTFQDFELIVVNDGSTDGTGALLKSYQNDHDFILIEQENKGLPRALNTGFSRATGEYLTWTSSDNIMLPEMLEVLSSALDRHPDVGMVYADWYLMNSEGKIYAQVETLDYHYHLLLRTNYVGPCFLYRKRCKEIVGDYDPSLIYAEDWDYWLRIARCAKLLRAPQPLYLYRMHEGSMTADLKQDFGERYRAFAIQWRRRTPFSWYYSKLLWKWHGWRNGRPPSLTIKDVESDRR